MLTKAQLNVLSTEMQDKRYANLLIDQDYPAIAALLNNRPMVANPVAQPTQPKQFDWATFVSLLTVAERLAMYKDYGNLTVDLRRAIEANDRVELVALWDAIKTVMLPATVTKVATAFSQSQADPTWTATVPSDSIAMTLELPRIEARDVQAVAA